MADWIQLYQPYLSPEPTGFRAEARNRLIRSARPAHDPESWKYTRLNDLLAKPFLPNLHPVASAPVRSEGIQWIDGQLSGKGEIGVNLQPLTEVLSGDSAWTQRFSPAADDFFGALTDSLGLNESVIRISRSVNPSVPVILNFTATGAGNRQLIPVNLWIDVEPRTEVILVDDYRGTGSGGYLQSVNVRLRIGEGAVVHHIRLQQEAAGAFHINRTTVDVLRDASYRSWVHSSGGSLIRNQFRVNLKGPGANSMLHGLALTTGSDQVENLTVIDHESPDCTSQESYKGILADASSVVFDGRIIVREGAQKTNASQSSRNLLLSNDATVNSKPQLEIYADDVKCYHGATVGQLDDLQLYYLRSRGISEDTARGLLIRAFASDVFSNLPVPSYQNRIARDLINRLFPGVDAGELE
ncbi:MAG: Fe-S cluster assembly protein SufD [Bacteroidetes bacterium]|nr:Fe-S cluster assembly protein SufD [Bacteroidota bacterium]